MNLPVADCAQHRRSLREPGRAGDLPGRQMREIESYRSTVSSPLPPPPPRSRPPVCGDAFSPPPSLGPVNQPGVAQSLALHFTSKFPFFSFSENLF